MEAIETVRERRPDLILMNISLKGNLDGIETAEAIHGQFEVPVIYATIFADESLLQRAKRSEAFCATAHETLRPPEL